MNNATIDSIPILLEVLETMTFMNGIVMPPEDIPTEIPGALEASLSFTGPANGVVRIWSDPELLETIADLLGDDECDSADILGEILNVVTGQIMTNLSDQCLAFDLGIPVVAAATQGSWILEAEVGAVDVEEMPILLQVCLG